MLASNIEELHKKVLALAIGSVISAQVAYAEPTASNFREDPVISALSKNAVSFGVGNSFRSGDTELDGKKIDNRVTINKDNKVVGSASSALTATADKKNIDSKITVINQAAITLDNPRGIGMTSDGKNIHWVEHYTDWGKEGAAYKAGVINDKVGVIKGEGTAMLSYNGGYIRNEGKINVSGPLSVGILAQTLDTREGKTMEPGVVTNDGEIRAKSEGLGVRLHRGGLGNSGSIVSEDTAIHCTGPYNVIHLSPGSLTEGKKRAVLTNGTDGDFNLIEFRGGTVRGNLVGNSDIDFLRIKPKHETDKASSSVALIDGEIQNFEFIYSEGKDWVVSKPVINPRDISTNGTVSYTMDDVPVGTKQTLQLRFTDRLPKTRTLGIDVEASGVASIDLSKDKRPAAKVNLFGGRIEKFVGHANSKDSLILQNGHVQNVDHIHNVTIASQKWSSAGLFSNIEAINLNKKGLLSELHVYGSSAPKETSTRSQTIRATTAKEQRMSLNAVAGSKTGTINIYGNASLGDLSMEGGRVVIHAKESESFELGKISNADSAIIHDTSLGYVLIGENPLVSPLGKNLVVATPKNHAFHLAAKHVGTLTIAKGAHLTGNIAKIKEIHLQDNDFKSDGWINARDLLADVSLKVLNIADTRSIHSIPLAESQLNIQTEPSNPLNISRIHSDGQVERVNIFKGASLGFINSVKDIWVEAQSWESSGDVNNLKSLHITAGGLVDNLMATDKSMSGSHKFRNQSLYLHFDENGVYDESNPLIVSNLGGESNLLLGNLETQSMAASKPAGKLQNLDFSARIKRPQLVFMQKGGDTGKIQGRHDRKDTLNLVKGQLREASNFFNVNLVGSEWPSTQLVDPKNINVPAGVEVNNLRVAQLTPSPKDKATLSTGFTDFKGEVNINSKGVLHRVNLMSDQHRPAFIIKQSGGSLGSVRGIAGKGDQLFATDTVVKKQLSDIDHIHFSGHNRYDGTLLNASGLININGTLTFTGKNVVVIKQSKSAKPTVHIHKGATVKIPYALNVEGAYQQDGRLVLTNNDPKSERLQPMYDGQSAQPPIVHAENIVIGHDAELDFDVSLIKNPAKGQKYLLMQSSVGNINQPVLIRGLEKLSIHFDTVIDPDNAKRMLLVSSADKVKPFIPVKPDKKLPPLGFKKIVKGGSKACEEDPDSAGCMLKKYIDKNIESKEKLAELYPFISPNAVDNTKLALDTAKQSLGDRLTGKHSGVEMGDLFSNGGFWLQYSYKKAEQDQLEIYPGYDAKANGFSIGVDSALKNNSDIDVGVAYTYVKGEAHSTHFAKRNLDSNTHVASLYSSYSEENFFFDGHMSYAFGKHKGSRFIDDSRHDSDYKTRSWGVGLNAGYTFALSSVWSWQPLVSFNYRAIKTDDYTEVSHNPAKRYFSLEHIENAKYEVMKLGGGLKLMGDINNGTIRPELKLMGFHDFKKDPIQVHTHFMVGGPTFELMGSSRDRNSYMANATLNMDVAKNTTVAFNYSHSWTDSFKVNGFIAKLRYLF